ncbi:MAG: response regulator [Phyllobacteriaceae bacterium]|nr:response regulator [Phyllobacteriaceae bacterium]
MRQNRAEGRDLRDLDVVFVDDVRQDQAIMRSILTGARVGRVRGFSNARDAHHAMLVEPPDVVVTDFEMPLADGLTLVRSMRDPRSGPLIAVPVILVAAAPTRSVLERAITLGVHHVIAKPVSPAAVIRRLESVLHDRRRFVYDEANSHFVLEDHDRLLAGQRQRWQDLLAGVRAFPTRREAASPPKVEEVGADELAAEPVEAKQKSRVLGFSAGPRHETAEGATGQRLERTA